MEQKINICSRLMAERGLTIAFAESATAGWLCSEFALTEDSGKVLKGGIDCYDADLKVSLLKVPQELIDRYTPESMEVTAEMARRLPALILPIYRSRLRGSQRPVAARHRKSRLALCSFLR